MKSSKIGALLLGTILIVQAPFQVYAASNDTIDQNKTEKAAPTTYMNNKALTATSDLELTIGEQVTKTIHIQDQPIGELEYGSNISDVKVVLTNMDGMNYNIVYGPKSADGTHYQYADVTLSGTPTKAGTGSFSLEYYDGAGNGGERSYTVNTQSTTTVKYVDKDGNKIAEDTVQAGDLNTAYTTEPKTIDGYTVDETKLPSNQNGQFGETNQTVTYTYTKNESEVNKGTVGISFYAEDGERQELVTSLDLSYAYPDGVPSDTVTFGDLANGASYNDLRPGTLPTEISWNVVLENTVAYMNGDIDAAQFEAAVGGTVDAFDVDFIAENFEGYEFDEAAYQANLDKMVTFEQNGGSVNLQVPFKKIAEVQAGADVSVKYVDADGNELAASETLSGNVDESYTSEAKTIDGWTLKETPANATGTFTDETQTVTYMYEKNTDDNVTPTPVDPDDNNNSSDDAKAQSDDSSDIPTDKDTVKGNSDSKSTNDGDVNESTTTPQVSGDTTTAKTQTSTPAKTSTMAKNSLPKTGDNALQSGLLVGLGAVLLGGLFIFLRKTRKAK
ncbi:MucBP domain-containing protein [Listeria ivanovii]|uniref:MucBP domain-containing protein n=2 Tax=Listeria ivanovii TaxID=1638 RepID=A0ABS1G3U8_LISIV|nr:MucBP domain-containing protein [Listeria ivanovii]AIS59239.1 cell surface protein [Listeria ivanovii subsp. londoniensis]AIS62074.1 cell surface protein [Listeria ivanovii subsp. londoniensis]MBK1961547.1 MucBP domain-containing protein [Listeria ivanovii subsp. londoniensis]MBK1965557.1 MucBP domain-containing protein [Listeria ivanovii subsp. londoniensis]MBK1983382.1 MucBP domain-containing protein [Listeria ivanovii subsp. londoniensis]